MPPKRKRQGPRLGQPTASAGRWQPATTPARASDTEAWDVAAALHSQVTASLSGSLGGGLRMTSLLASSFISVLSTYESAAVRLRAYLGRGS